MQISLFFVQSSLSWRGLELGIVKWESKWKTFLVPKPFLSQSLYHSFIVGKNSVYQDTVGCKRYNIDQNTKRNLPSSNIKINGWDHYYLYYITQIYNMNCGKWNEWEHMTRKLLGLESPTIPIIFHKERNIMNWHGTIVMLVSLLCNAVKCIILPIIKE